MPASAFTRRRLTVLLSGAAAMSPHISRAQETSRPLRIIVPWPAGGGVDTFARVIQAPLGRQLGQTILIDNIGGGSGRVGTQAAARAQPDGYTVLLANDTFAATEALPLPGTVSVRASFAPVTLAAAAPQGVFTHPHSGLKTLADYVARAKEKPGALNVGIPGIASSQHLTSELLLRAAGNATVAHIPYRGVAPSITAALSGEVKLLYVGLGGAVPHIKAGKLVPLAVTMVAAAGAKTAQGTPASLAVGCQDPSELENCGMADPAMVSATSTRLLEDLMRYIRFSAEDAELMKAMGPILRDSFLRIVESFYDAIDRTPGASAVFTASNRSPTRSSG